MSTTRTTILTAALAGGSIVGLAGVTGIADAATPSVTDVAVAAVGDPAAVGTDVDDTTRAERHAARHALREANRQEIADVLGVSVDDLRTELRGGATLADVAEANGVAVSDVVDVIVQQMNERLDTAVENERLTAEEADEKRADLEERVQTRVEEGRPDRGEGVGRRGHRHGAGDGNAEDAASTDAATDTETEDAGAAEG